MRSKIARDLASPKYHQRVIANKKRKHQEMLMNEHDNITDTQIMLMEREFSTIWAAILQITNDDEDEGIQYIKKMIVAFDLTFTEE